MEVEGVLSIPAGIKKNEDMVRNQLRKLKILCCFFARLLTRFQNFLLLDGELNYAKASSRNCHRQIKY